MRNKNTKMKSKNFFIAIGFILPLSTFLIASCSTNQPQNNITNDDKNFTTLSLDPKGGTLDNGNLKVSKYISLLKHLNFTKTTLLSSLNDQMLNQKIHSLKDFKNLTLKIENGSTQDGTLVLTLNGQYKNDPIIKDIFITITGFLKINKNTQFSFQSFELNLDNWFSDLKPIDNVINVNDINLITKKEWLNKYLKSFQIISNSTFWDKNTFLNYGFNFEDFKGQLSVNSSSINFSINVSYNSKIYEKGNWNIKETINFSINSFNISTLNLPKSSALQQWLIDQIQLDEKEISTHYPSYWMSIAELYKNSFGSYDWSMEKIVNKEFINKIKDFYIKKPIAFVLYGANEVDDFRGKLSFTLILKIEDQEFTNIQRNFDNFKVEPKKLSNLNFINDVVSEHQVTIKHPLNVKENIWFNWIKKYLKTINKNEIDTSFQMSNGEFKEIKVQYNNLVAPNIIDNNSLIKFYSSDEEAIKQFDIFKKHFTPTIFNTSANKLNEISLTTGTPGLPPTITKNSINKESHLFNYSDDPSNAFYIEDIRYSFSRDFIPIKITKSLNGIYIEIKGKTSIVFISNIFKEYNTNFFMNLTEKTWNE